jgi:hypothetical protein
MPFYETHPQVACTVQNMLHCMHWVVMDHTPYNLELSKCVLALQGCRCRLDKHVKAKLVQWLQQHVGSCGGNPLASMSIGFLPQSLWELFLSFSMPSPKSTQTCFIWKKPNISKWIFFFCDCISMCW